MEEYFENRQGTVNFEADTGAVHMRFNGFLGGEPYRELLLKGLELAKAKGLTLWLSDMREASVVEPADHAWSGEVWTPRAWEIGIRWIAAAMPANVIAGFQLERTVDELQAQEQNPYVRRMMMFPTVDKARGWLLARSAEEAEEARAVAE